MKTCVDLSVQEPLAELAAFAFDWAHCLCDPQAGCKNYHRAWGIVRLIEGQGALPAGGAFFERALLSLALDGRIRILLSGAADTGLAALVVQALRQHDVEPQIVLVDRCATTLEQNRLFARHAKFDLQTYQMDARDLNIPPVDAILVHSFLGFFAPDARQAVVNMWARNLAPTGRILMSNRLSRDAAKLRPLPDAQALATRTESFLTKALSLGYTAARAKAMADAAQTLWQSRTNYPQLEENELLGLLDKAGLAVVHMERDPSGKSASPVFLAANGTGRDRVELTIAHSA